MKLIYGKGWFRAKNRMTEVWAEAKAEAVHKNRKSYAVCFEENGFPVCFAEFNDKYVGVGFLDDDGQEHTSYQFQEKETGKLFLSMAVHREFDGGSPYVKFGTVHFFKTDGKVIIEKDDFIARTKTTFESFVEVWANWESYPTFGEYDEITKLERGIEWSHF